MNRKMYTFLMQPTLLLDIVHLELHLQLNTLSYAFLSSLIWIVLLYCRATNVSLRFSAGFIVAWVLRLTSNTLCLLLADNQRQIFLVEYTN